MTMPSPTPLSALTTRALQVLIQELGPVNTARFLAQFTTGYGDYTCEKEALFGALRVEDLAQAIISARRPPASPT